MARPQARLVASFRLLCSYSSFVLHCLQDSITGNMVTNPSMAGHPSSPADAQAQPIDTNRSQDNYSFERNKSCQNKSHKINTNQVEDEPLPDLRSNIGNRNGVRSQPPRPSCSNLSEILWSASAVVLPLTLVTAVMLGLVYGYRLDPGESSTIDTSGYRHTIRGSYLYVNLPANRLLFLTSASSSIAPVLIAFAMALWRACLAFQIARLSQKRNFETLATPYQLSLIINMTAGSLSQLFMFFKYLLWGRKAVNSRILTKTASVICIAGLLSIAVFAADTIFHYTTDTVPYRHFLPSASAQHLFGRGIPDFCLHFNRTENHGYPCTFDAETNTVRNATEEFALWNNMSIYNEIGTYADENLTNGDMLLLLPSSRSGSPQLDYSASTIGVSTQCRTITNDCHMHLILGDDNGSNNTGQELFTKFNCSKAFWGTLSNNIVGEFGWKPDNFSVPAYNYKGTTKTYQYGYYSDAELEQPYSTHGPNPFSVTSLDPGAIVPDSDLINPIYYALAIIIPNSNVDTSRDLIKDNVVFPTSNNTAMLAYSLSCSLATYNVDYQWVNNSILRANFTQFDDGSVTEYFHGVDMGFSYEEILPPVQTTFSCGTSQAFSRAWANTFSRTALNVIGTVVSPRNNLAETAWEDILVARVSKVALWCWVVANLLFALLGVGLAVRAYLVSSSWTRDIAIRISTAGMTAAAFEDTVTDCNGRAADVEDLFEERRLGGKTRRIGASDRSSGGFQLTAVFAHEDEAARAREADYLQQ